MYNTLLKQNYITLENLKTTLHPKGVIANVRELCHFQDQLTHRYKAHWLSVDTRTTMAFLTGCA